jgi:hypothetical protein
MANTGLFDALLYWGSAQKTPERAVLCPIAQEATLVLTNAPYSRSGPAAVHVAAPSLTPPLQPARRRDWRQAHSVQATQLSSLCEEVSPNLRNLR